MRIFLARYICGKITAIQLTIALLTKIQQKACVSLCLTFSLTMFMHPAGQPLSLSNSTPSFKREFAAPDPADHGACACFRMHRKAFQASSFCHPSPATALQLQQMKLEFYQRLHSLNWTILQQACAFSEHLASCTSMVNTLANLVRVSPMLIHPSQPLHCNEDHTPFGQNSTSPNPASSIPISSIP